jgi:two-component system, OmpR family, KDP operon response regulator KdpE
MSPTSPLLLLIEDEPPMRRFLRTSLKAEGYQLVEAATAREGLGQFAGRNPDVVLLDLGLPDQDGLTVVRSIRSQARTPIIVLSARGRESDKVQALDLGADDYLTKPFGVPELLARLRVALRRAARPQGGRADDVVSAGLVRVDLGRRRVWRGEDEVHLTPNEYRLLAALFREAGQVLTHRQLLQDVWGANYVDQTHYLRVYMAQLRHKLEVDPTRPRVLLTEPGVGYRVADGG